MAKDNSNYTPRLLTKYNEELYRSFLHKPIFSKKMLEIFNDPDEKYFKLIAQKIIE